MSKYTTQVRFICESKSGREVSGGSGDVDKIIEGSWNKIFTSKAPFFDEAYRSVLCQKILKHYYLREICCETVGIWTLWMNTRLEEIMPYYNQLYKSELLKFEPLQDVDYTREHTRNTDETGNVDSSGTSSNKELYSDTPQGSIQNLDNETYLTNATKTDGTATSKTDTTNNTTEEYTEKILGKQAGKSYSKLLQEFRETFLNIDMMVIDEFSDLFFGLW